MNRDSGRRRQALLIALLAVCGLGAAAGVGLAVNEVSGDSIGLSAKPLEAGDVLAPPAARDEATRPLRNRNRTAERRNREPTSTRTAPAAASPTAELGDDGGQGRGRGRGRDRSDESGSNGSGSGGSGSSGSGKSGSDD